MTSRAILARSHPLLDTLLNTLLSTPRTLDALRLLYEPQSAKVISIHEPNTKTYGLVKRMDRVRVDMDGKLLSLLLLLLLAIDYALRLWHLAGVRDIY